MNRQELINQIMDNFNFNKVVRVMNFLDWRWRIGSEYLVPEEPEVRQRVRERLNKVYEHAVGQGRKYSTSTGGFNYSYNPQQDCLSLEFNLETWDAYPNDHNERAI